MKTRSRPSHHGPGRYVYGWSDPRAWSPSALRRDYYWHKWKGWVLYVILVIAIALLFTGCATTMYAGVGYDIGNHEIRGVLESDNPFAFTQETWDNPIGIIGLTYPLGEHWDLDYRHISPLGSKDIVTSDALTVIVKIGGSRAGWGLRDR